MNNKNKISSNTEIHFQNHLYDKKFFPPSRHLLQQQHKTKQINKKQSNKSKCNKTAPPPPAAPLELTGPDRDVVADHSARGVGRQAAVHALVDAGPERALVERVEAEGVVGEDCHQARDVVHGAAVLPHLEGVGGGGGGGKGERFGDRVRVGRYSCHGEKPELNKFFLIESFFLEVLSVFEIWKSTRKSRCDEQGKK